TGVWSCDGGTFVAPNKVTVALGAQVTCTIVNTDDTPKLKLVKDVQNDDGGTKTAADWNLTATPPVPHAPPTFPPPTATPPVLPRSLPGRRLPPPRDTESSRRAQLDGPWVVLRRGHERRPDDRDRAARRAGHLHHRQHRRHAQAQAGQAGRQQRRRRQDRGR